MIKLSPSILAADFSKLGEEVKRVSEAGCDYIHIDVMDGLFVQNITLGPTVIKAIRPYSDKVFDVHLMIDEPIRYIDEFVSAGADIITIHVEACKDVRGTIDYIKSKGIKVGLTMKPETPCSMVEQYVVDVDMILIMSVNPGFGGQSFIEESYSRISKVRSMINDYNTVCDVEVDGGINLSNLKKVIDAGANVIVAGSAVFATDNVIETIKDFKDIFNSIN